MYEPWPGSLLSLFPSSSDGFSVLSFDRPVLWFLLAALFITVVFFRMTASGLAGSIHILSSENRAKEILQSNSIGRSILIVFLESLPFLSYEVIFSQMTIFNYWIVLAVAAGYFIFRHWVYGITGWLTGKGDAFRSIEKISFAVTALLVSALCVPLVLSLSGIAISYNLFRIIAVVMLSIGLFAYFIRGYQIFNHSGSTLFSWILYLCTLEILPLCVVVTVVIS